MFDHEALKKALYSRGVKQKRLSEMTGIPRNSISRYVTGETQPDPGRAAAIAGALGVPLHFLVAGGGKAPARGAPKHQNYCHNCGAPLGGGDGRWTPADNC